MRAMMLVMAAVLAITLGEGAAMAAAADSKVLEGVPKVDHDTHFCSLAGSLESVMRYVGDPTDYDYLMGVTGLAFRRLWNRDDGGNAGPLRFAPEAVRRAFWTLGYDYEILPPTLGRAALLQAVKDSLAKGRPLLASGIVGPPECEIVTGYSKGGNVLHGWSEFQDFDPWRQYQDPSIPGYYAKPDWYEKAEWANGVAFIAIGDKRPGPLPPKREVLLSSLRWAIELERAKTWPGIANHSAGLAAYDDWAKAIEVDADYPKDDAKVMEARHGVLMDQAVMVEERGNAARFLRQMADAAPEAADTLKAAADLYEQVGKEAGPVYPWGPNWAKPDLADPAVRREIAKHIRTAAENETKAVALLEKAVAAMKAQSAPADRKVLEGVPRIGYGVHLSPFPGSLYAVLQYLSDPCDYDYIMGVSGAAFRRTWNRDDGGNVDLSYFGEEPYKAILDALGYEYRMVPPKDKAVMVKALKESIAQKRPVLAFGIVGPPECGIVAGYDKGGDVLIGESYFQAGEGPVYYEQPDWFAKANWNGVTGFLVLGERKPKPAPRAVLLSSLERAIRFERMKTLGKNHSAGLAAYADWAKGLETDADYPKDDAKVLETRVMVHGDQCVMLEERRDAAKYLRRMATVAPEAAEALNAAATLYDQVADQGGQTWPWGNRYADVGPDLADPAARREIAKHVRIAAEKEAQAAALLEKAVAAMETAPRHASGPPAQAR